MAEEKNLDTQQPMQETAQEVSQATTKENTQENIQENIQTNSQQTQKGTLYTSEKEQQQYEKINKNYKIIYSVIFRYGLIILVFALAIIIFSILIKKEKTLTFSDEFEVKQQSLIANFYKEKENNVPVDQNLKTIIKHGTLNISDNLLHSYNNLITYKGFTMPRGTFLYEPDELIDKDYFNDPNYSIENLQKLTNKIIFVGYNEIGTKQNKQITFLPLKDGSVEETFFVSCVNKTRIFNGICNNYVDKFINGFFVYKISDDFPGLTKTFKNIMGQKKYKTSACEGLKNYITYSNTAPSQIEDIAILCGGEYLEQFNITQDFIQVTNELENKYIKSNISKYKEINEYKLISYQQILYNNLENGIPPYEGTFRDYTNYLANILQKTAQNPISSIYYDMTFRFNNFYLVPNLNKLKYQSTSSKREEIEAIISEIEKINNGSNIDGYVGLKNMITNKILEEEIKKIGANISVSTDDVMTTLLKNIKSQSYLKIINEEVYENIIKINGYLSINIKGSNTPLFFGSTLENKKGVLIVNEISLSEYDELNETLGIIISQRDYTLPEIYEYIQSNIGLYISENLNITPCDIIINRLDELNIETNVLHCDENKINIIKGSSGSKILYQIKMDQYNIQNIVSTNREIQTYIDNNYSGINTNSITISNIVGNIIAYEPQKDISQTLEGSNIAITAIDDFRNYLGVNVVDIAESNGKVAAEFEINSISFIGIYDTRTKKLGPLFLKQEAENKDDINFKTFSLYLTPENQNEINRFLIETIQYLKNIDTALVNKYINEE